MSILKCYIPSSEKQSRSDDTLLTVDVIYGQDGLDALLPKSRMGPILSVFIMPSLRDFAPCAPSRNPEIKTSGSSSIVTA